MYFRFTVNRFKVRQIRFQKLDLFQEVPSIDITNEICYDFRYVIDESVSYRGPISGVRRCTPSCILTYDV